MTHDALYTTSSMMVTWVHRLYQELHDLLHVFLLRQDGLHVLKVNELPGFVRTGGSNARLFDIWIFQTCLAKTANQLLAFDESGDYRRRQTLFSATLNVDREVLSDFHRRIFPAKASGSRKMFSYYECFMNSRNFTTNEKKTYWRRRAWQGNPPPAPSASVSLGTLKVLMSSWMAASWRQPSSIRFWMTWRAKLLISTSKEIWRNGWKRGHSIPWPKTLELVNKLRKYFLSFLRNLLPTQTSAKRQQKSKDPWP